MHGFFAVDGPASRRTFVFGIVLVGASRCPPQSVIRYPPQKRETSMGIYEEIGVRPFINAGGWTYTRYGGSIMPGEVLAAMVEASKQFVNIYKLQESVGNAIAKLTSNEAALVSCGAASGILLAVAACIAGTDEDLAGRLPETSGMRNQVVMFRCERGTEADPAIRAAGGRIVDVGGPEGAAEEHFVAAINEQTAAVVILAGVPTDRRPDTARVVELAHTRSIPVLVDGAYGIPPKQNLWHFTRELGVDAFITSGGKAIRGPQSTGLVLGTRAIIEGCRFHSSPNLRIGRGMKVGKEEFAGIYRALQLFLDDDEQAKVERHARQAARLQELVGHLPGIQVNFDGTSAQVTIDYNPDVIDLSPEAIEKEMLDGEPSILLMARGHRIIVRPGLLQEGEEVLVGRRLRQILQSRSSSREPASGG